MKLTHHTLSLRKGDLIEKGVMRRLPDGFDGNTCPYIFTWSDERPNKVRQIHICIPRHFYEDMPAKIN
jgi:hypothetical protein